MVASGDITVELKDLVKGAQYNGRVGKTNSGPIDGRYTVELDPVEDEPSKQLKVKPANIQVSNENLSIKQMKLVLDKSSVSYAGVAERQALRNLVGENCTSEFILNSLLPPETAKQPLPTGTVPQMDSNLAKEAGDRLGQMSPDQLRRQAQTIKSMSSAQLDGLRRTNPQFASLTDDQIRMSATQMEMMADNPTMMQTTAAQLKAGHIPGQTSSTSPQQAAEQLKSMTPEQLKAQSEMIKNMTPAQLQQLRAQNPQFKDMSDEAIRASANMMAENPDMVKMAQGQGAIPSDMNPAKLKAMCQTQLDMIKGNPSLAEQIAKSNPQTASLGAEGLESYLKSMVDMDDEQLEKMLEMQKKMTSVPNVDPAKPEEVMKNMSKEDRQHMMKMQQDMLKQNPQMLKEMMKDNPMFKGMSQEQIDKQLDAIANMDPDQLEKMMNMAQKIQGVTQPLMNTYQAIDSKLGGNLFSVLMVMLAIVVCYVIDRFVYSFSG